MKATLWLATLLLSLASTLPAQARTLAQRLGLPADAKMLIVHADDLGVARSVECGELRRARQGCGLLGEHHDADALGHGGRDVCPGAP